MNNVIHHNFQQEESEGYVIDDRKVKGVYCGNLSAVKENDNVCIGVRFENGDIDTTSMKFNEMNRLCLMWLAIYDPNVLKFEEEDNG